MDQFENPIPWADIKMSFFESKSHTRRNKEQIMADVLTKSLEPIIPTHLMYQTNLSWSVLRKLISTLSELGLIKRVEFSPNKRTTEVIVCTEEGKLYLKAWKEVKKYSP
jgi:predicted transcriptional regulator